MSLERRLFARLAPLVSDHDAEAMRAIIRREVRRVVVESNWRRAESPHRRRFVEAAINAETVARLKAHLGGTA